MNPMDDQLMRLFRAARKPAADSAAIPYGLETRAMAAWRTSRRDEGWFWDTRLLGRGLAVAIGITAVSCWPLLSQASSVDPVADYVQQADTSLTTDVTP